jgi:PBP1b-binding outer membrane lipoprotein LpoB
MKLTPIILLALLLSGCAAERRTNLCQSKSKTVHTSN